MANKEHLAIFKQGVKAWNEWRNTHPEIKKPDLSGADLSGVDFSKSNRIISALLLPILADKINNLRCISLVGYKFNCSFNSSTFLTSPQSTPAASRKSIALLNHERSQSFQLTASQVLTKALAIGSITSSSFQ